MKTITLKQGDTLRRRISLKYIGTNAPVDLTGCHAYSQLRTHPGGQLKADGTVTIDTAQGVIVTLFTSAQTGELEPADYGFDIRLESEGDVKTIYERGIRLVKPYTELE